MLKSKIHRAIVTETDLNYEGSIAIDKDLMDAAGLIAFEVVSIFDVHNGNRFETYVIEGEKGSGVISINGAAARLVHIGDPVIIVSYALLSEEEIKKHKPAVILIKDPSNKKFKKEKK